MHHISVAFYPRVSLWLPSCHTVHNSVCVTLLMCPSARHLNTCSVALWPHCGERKLQIISLKLCKPTRVLLTVFVFSELPLHICWCPENCCVSLYTVILYTPVHVKLGGHSEKCYNRVCSVWHSSNDMRQRKWFEMTLLLMLHTPAYANFTHAFVIEM